MIIGMTGSRDGISEDAFANLIKFLNENMSNITEGHHGDCKGADTIFHNELTKMEIKTIVHPPSVKTMRSFCEGDEIRDPKSYLERNKDIVNESDLLIAFPSTQKEVLRSGTWSTIRYARKQFIYFIQMDLFQSIIHK